MKLKTKRVIFWVVAVALIILFATFGFLSTWTAYSQLASGLGQEPNVLGYFGYLFATGGK